MASEDGRLKVAAYTNCCTLNTLGYLAKNEDWLVRCGLTREVYENNFREQVRFGTSTGGLLCVVNSNQIEFNKKLLEDNGFKLIGENKNFMQHGQKLYIWFKDNTS